MGFVSAEKAANYCETTHSSKPVQCLQASYNIFYTETSDSRYSVEKAAEFCTTTYWAGSDQCLQGSYDIFYKAYNVCDSLMKAASYCETSWEHDPTACLENSYDMYDKAYNARDSADKAAAACSRRSLWLSGVMPSQMHAVMMMVVLSASCLVGIIVYIRHFHQNPSISQVPLLG